MDFNWCALAVAIIKGVLPEQAFSLMEDNTKVFLPPEDTADMIRFRQQGMSYAAIGELYGTDSSNVFYRIKAYERRLKGGRDMRNMCI